MREKRHVSDEEFYEIVDKYARKTIIASCIAIGFSSLAIGIMLLSLL